MVYFIDTIYDLYFEPMVDGLGLKFKLSKSRTKSSTQKLASTFSNSQTQKQNPRNLILKDLSTNNPKNGYLN